MNIKKKANIEHFAIENPDELQVGIVVSRWNANITDKLYEGCKSKFIEHGILEENITTIFVPGSYELPYGAKLLVNQEKYAAIVCLGCVIQGETKHDDYINFTIAQSLSNLSLALNIPVIYGVVTTNTEDQAVARSGGDKGHKGIESAEAALDLIALEKSLNAQKRKIGFS